MSYDNQKRESFQMQYNRTEILLPGRFWEVGSMTIEQCYQALGGDYDQMVRRVSSPERVGKFLAMFLEDDSFAQLCRILEQGSREEAMQAAITLKGVSGNLSFTRLFDSTSRLAQALRPGEQTDPAPFLEQVRQDYEQTVRAIRACLELP